VKKFMPHYKLTDSRLHLDSTAIELRERYAGTVKSVKQINGFFMMAKTKTWWDGAYNSEYVINPKELMNNGAYELQGRLRKRGLKIGIVPSAFIFHYRAVSRGRVGLRGEYGNGAFRAKEENTTDSNTP
jgi:hypothetical protein